MFGLTLSGNKEMPSTISCDSGGDENIPLRTILLHGASAIKIDMCYSRHFSLCTHFL